MLMIKRAAFTAILLLAAAPLAVFAQEPSHERVTFTISAPYQLRKSDAVFPAGKYVLFQPTESDPNLFALYKDDMRHSPLALIRVTQVEYASDKYPERTAIILDTDEPRADSLPVVEGWTDAGLDGWQVSEVVASRKHIPSATN
jgi:hypothetical protein